jgi:hypothetical protein
MPFLLPIVTFDIFRQRQTILNCIYDLLNSIREIHSYITCLSDGALLAPTAISVVPLTLPLGIVFVRQPHKISLHQCRILLD